VLTATATETIIWSFSTAAWMIWYQKQTHYQPVLFLGHHRWAGTRTWSHDQMQ